MFTRKHTVDELEMSREAASIVKLQKCRRLEDDISVIREYLESKPTSLHRRETS